MTNYAFRSTGTTSATITGPLSAFGEVDVAQLSPSAQVAFVYALEPQQVLTRTYLTGASVTAVNGEAVLASGTATTSYARLTSSQVTKYKPGQGTAARWTARFSAGSAGNQQLAGLSNQEAGYQVGYVNDAFGILYTKSGTLEVQTLTVTVAPAAPGNVSITLDGSGAVAVAVTASGSTAICAYQISQGSFGQSSGGWSAQALGNVVYFTRRITGPSTVLSTFAAGGTGAAAAFAVLTPGVAANTSFIPQASWNGTTPTGFDPLKGNVYGVQFQYLGYGDAFFYIEDGATGRFSLVHTVQNAGTVTSPVLRNPNLYLTWESRNIGTATSKTLYTASGGSFIEGLIAPPPSKFAQVVTKTVGAGVETPVLSVRANTVYTNRVSMGQLTMARTSVSADGTKPVEVRLYRNSTLTAAQFATVDTFSCAAYDQLATVATGGQLVFAFTVDKTGSDSQELGTLNITIQAGETLTITAKSANANDVSATLAWFEDV